MSSLSMPLGGRAPRAASPVALARTSPVERHAAHADEAAHHVISVSVACRGS
eukprot:SAG11_NODE_34003_length_274_cov_0.760000_1_plen_51_part_10